MLLPFLKKILKGPIAAKGEDSKMAMQTKLGGHFTVVELSR